MQPADTGSGTVAMGAVLATLAGQAFFGGGEPGALFGAALAPYTTHFMQRVRAEWTRKGRLVTETTARLAHLPPEEVFARVSADPALIALMQRIAEASARTASDEKLR